MHSGLVKAALLLICAVTVTLQHGSLQSGVKPRADETCPDEAAIAPCTCNQNSELKTVLTCENLASDEEFSNAVSADYPPGNYYSLFLSHTNVTTIDSMPAGIAFERIYLFYNDLLTSIAPDVFSDSAATLQYLDVSHTAMPSADFILGSLSGYNVIDFLNMDFSPVSSLPILDSPIFRQLQIKNGEITSVTPGTFDASPNLQTIALQNNKITEIQARTFPLYESLMGLSLDGNLISTVESGAIYLPGTIEPTTNTIRIGLSQNELETIPASFLPLVNRKYTIDLYNNSISVVTEGAFYIEGQTDHLDVSINLEHNLLATIDEPAFADIFPYVTNFEIGGNPLECGCDIAWIINSPTYRAIIDPLTPCASGSTFGELNADDFADC